MMVIDFFCQVCHGSKHSRDFWSSGAHHFTLVSQRIYQEPIQGGCKDSVTRERTHIQLAGGRTVPPLKLLPVVKNQLRNCQSSCCVPKTNGNGKRTDHQAKPSNLPLRQCPLTGRSPYVVHRRSPPYDPLNHSPL